MATINVSIKTPERGRLFGLAALTIFIGIGLSIWMPPISAPSLILAYTVIFVTLRLAARHHKQRSLPHKEAHQISTHILPKVSILIPLHNEESVIAQTIETLLKLDYPDFEIFVIDDRSSDETASILRELQATLGHRFQILSRDQAERAGKPAALNDVFPHTQGEILLILDADGLVDADFLKRLIPLFKEASVGAVQARKILINASQNWLTFCQKYEYSLDAYFQTRRDTFHGAVELRGNGMLIRRKALEALGGWNEASLTEDLDLSTRLHAAGWDIRYAPTTYVREEALCELQPLMRQRLRWTEGSLIRYLENAEMLLLNPQVAFRTKLDLMQFVFEFLAPLWLLTENMMIAFKWWTGQLSMPPVLFSSSALLVFSAYFVYALYQGITKFNRVSLLQSLQAILMTYLYLSLLWLPLVFILLIRILFQRERNLKWDKTPHFGMAME